MFGYTALSVCVCVSSDIIIKISPSQLCICVISTLIMVIVSTTNSYLTIVHRIVWVSHLKCVFSFSVSPTPPSCLTEKRGWASSCPKLPFRNYYYPGIYCRLLLSIRTVTKMHIIFHSHKLAHPQFSDRKYSITIRNHWNEPSISSHFNFILNILDSKTTTTKTHMRAASISGCP